MDITKQLNEYQVEYHVLQEEMAAVQPQVEELHKLEILNKSLTSKNKSLSSQLELAQSNVLRLEKTRTLQQSSINKLEMQTRTLEVTVATLGNFINSLVDNKVDIEIPDDILRILSQITYNEKRKVELKNPLNNNLMSMFKSKDKVMVKSLSTGKISIHSQNESSHENVLRCNSLNTNSKEALGVSKDSHVLNNFNNKSHFFSQSHNQILQQRVYSKSQTNPIIDITLHDCIEPTKGIKDDKSVNLQLDDKLSVGYNGSKLSPTNSIDSGIVTPSSPKDVIPHPLSNCDVQFTFNGTREVKNIKSLKNLVRNSSPDMLAK